MSNSKWKTKTKSLANDKYLYVQDLPSQQAENLEKTTYRYAGFNINAPCQRRKSRE